MITLPVLVDHLLPSYSKAHNCLEEEVSDDIKRGLVDARLPDLIRDAIWNALKKGRPGVHDDALLDGLSKAMAKNRLPQAAPDRVVDKMAALFASIDANVGRASLQTRSMLETEQGKKALDKSLEATGEWLASRLMPIKN